MNRKWLLIIALLAVPLAICIADDVDGSSQISIETVSYDISSGNLSYDGVIPAFGDGTVTVTLEVGEDVHFTKTESVGSSKYSGMLNVGILQCGSYKLTVESERSGFVKAVKYFPINSLIEIKDVSFDELERKVRYTGVTNMESVDVNLAAGKEHSAVTNVVPRDGIFSGSLELTDNLFSERLIIEVTSSDCYCMTPVEIGKIIIIDDFSYDRTKSEVSWSGKTTEQNLSIEVFNSSKQKVFSAFSIVDDRAFVGKMTKTLTDGTYTLKAVSVDDKSVMDEKTLTVSSSGSGSGSGSTVPSVNLLKSSDANATVFKGYTRSISFVLTNCTNDQVVVTSNNGSVVQVLSENTLDKSNQITLKGISIGSAEIKVTPPNGGTPIFLNITVEEDTGTPNDLYYFYIKINETEYKKVESSDNELQSNLAMTDFNEGSWYKGHGNSAKEALMDISHENGWNLSFDERFYEGWLDKFMDLKTVNNNDGTYTYWVQYHWDGSKWIYNQYALGYLKTTEYRYLAMTYDTTQEDIQSTNLGVTPADIPADLLEPETPVNPDDPTPSHTHIWGEGTVTKAPTCTDTGVRTYTCGCGETRIETIPALGHKWSEWTVVKQATDEEDGLKERICSVCGEKETETIAKTVIVINDDGTTTKTEVELDGTVVSTTTGAEDGSTKVDKVKEDVDENGNQITTSSSEVIDKDGNTTSSSNVVKDAEGNEIYSKTEEFVPETTVTDDSGNQVTTSSSTSVEKEAGKTTETETETVTTVATDGSKESVTTTVETVTEADGGTAVKTVEESVKESADGAKETEVVSVESISSAEGSTTERTVTESTKQSADGSSETSKVTEVVKEDEGTVLSSTQTETKDRDGKETFEKKVEAESKDGSVKSTVEIPQETEKAEIVTTVKTGSDDGDHAITAEQVQQAIAIQEKVSQEISGDVKEQTKVIQIESETSDAALTVSQDAVKAVSESGSGLRVSSEKGSLTASSQVLGNISEEDQITISITEAKDGDMNDAQKETISDDAVVVDVRIMSGEKSLGSMLGGTITISVKYTPADGKIAVAYYVDDNGGKERMEGSSYDPAKGEVSFESTHCSLYMIVDEDPAQEPVEEPEKAENSSDDNTMLYIGIAVAVIAVIAICAVVYMRKN